MRAFIGFMAPDGLRDRIAAEWERVAEKPHGLRHIADKSWHVSLTFLGDVDEGNIPEITERLKDWAGKAAKTPFSLTRFETFPTKNPRYIAAHFDIESHERMPGAGHAVPLLDAAVTRLRDVLSIYAPEIDRKPFHPHMSLAKAKSGVRLPKWEQRIDPLEWFPEHISLVKSVPGPNGSEYTPIEAFTWKP